MISQHHLTGIVFSSKTKTRIDLPYKIW